MIFIKKLYNKICRRIYSVGKYNYEKEMIQQYHNHAQIGLNSFIYPCGGVNNFSNDRTKIQIGDNTHIYGLLIIYNYAGEIIIGNNCSLSEGSRIVSSNKIIIGNRVMIAHNVNILDNISHPINALDRHRDFMEHYSIGMQTHDLKSQEIVIEDDVWIGFNSTIMKGVKIGRGSIIGANSVVTKDVAPWTVNVGNPLRLVRKLEQVNF